MKKPIAKIYEAGEALYLHPYAFDPTFYPESKRNKILWFYISEFEPMNLYDNVTPRKFPWIRFHLKNMWQNFKWTVTMWRSMGHSFRNAWTNFKHGNFKYALQDLKDAVFYNRYYLIYPTYGVEMAPVRLGIRHNLMVDNDVTENHYFTPSNRYILFYLDWELEKVKAGTSTLSDFQQDNLLQFEVWKRKMYEHGYEIKFMCELDT